MGFEELWDGFEKVDKRTNDGEQFTGSVLRYFTKRQKLELEYAKALIHLAEGMKEDNEIGTTKEMWVALQTETKTLGEERSKFCEKMKDLTASVAKNLTESKKSRSVLVQRGTKLVTELAKTEDVMKKARTRYVEARKLQSKSVQAIDKAKQANSSNVSKLQKAAEKDEKRADKSDNEYRISVNGLRQHQDKYYEQDMPALLKDFEEHERLRLEQVKDYVQKFLDLWTPVVPATKSSNDRFQTKIKEIDVRSDLNLYVEQNRPESDQPPARAQYLSFDGAVVEPGAPTPSNALVVAKREPFKQEKKEKPEKFKGLGLGKKKDEKEKTDASSSTSSKSLFTKSNSERSISKAEVSVEIASPNEEGEKKHIKTESSSHITIATPTVTTTTPTVSATVTATTPAAEPPAAAIQKSDKPNSELTELVTIYAYEATEENELTFEEGETIYLIEKDESGWWRGRNKKGVEGVFPSNFVEVVGEEGQGGGSGTIEINADYTALYDYDAEDETELTIKEGEPLHVISETDGWYYGTNAKGQKGNFPSNFVERVQK